MTQPLTFVVLSADRGELHDLRTALAADGRARVLMAGDDMDQVSAGIVRMRPSAAIITLSESAEPAFALIKRVAIECPDTVIICASHSSSPDLILRSLRSGAREFLRLPIVAEEFKTVLDRTEEFCIGHAKTPKKRGRAIAIFSNKGGCGVSFVAANLAAVMVKPTVLVDLNLQGGDLDLFLGVESKFSITNVVENHARLDDALLAGYLAPHSTNLSLLAAPREAGAAEDIKAEHIVNVIQVMRERYDYVVMDTQHSYDEITLAALDQADNVLLVLPVDIASIRSAQRSLAIFDRLGYPRHKVRVVINRWSKQVELDLRQIERSLGERVAGFIPNDYRAVVNSINLGQPLVESQPSSAIAGEMKRIAASLTGSTEGQIETEPRRGKLRSMFRRGSASENMSLRETLDKA